MALEDYTGYEEVDPATDLTVNANDITYDTVRNDEVCYVRKDMDADHFGDFVHLLDTKTTYPAIQTSYFGVWGVSLAAKTIYEMTTLEEGITVFVLGSTTPRRLYIKEYSTENTDYWEGMVVDTMYYLIIKRVGTAATVEIYSDSARSDLLDTLSIVVPTTRYRWILAAYGFGHPTYFVDRLSSGYIENLDLLPIIAPTESLVITRDFHVGGI